MASPHDRLRELGITLPRPPAPVASYVPTLLVPLGEGRSLLYIAGQISSRDGDRLTGRCLDQVDLAKAQDAARAAAINVLAQIEGACGLDSVEQLLQVSGYVLSAEGFGDQPKVLNAASDLFGEVFGEGGRHTRVALGVNALPFSVTVEISAVVAVRSR
ncbi:MAG: RidA family protein [Candidatus Dormibacteraeota bacterium]|nr:RidA family protein [Candidatus Dormibacteraeota bacterium]